MNQPTKTLDPRLVLGAILAVVAMLVIVLAYFGSVVVPRNHLARFLTDQGGRVVYVDQADRSGNSPTISLVRRVLGDRAAIEVVLPYGRNDLDDEVRELFPEATFSVQPGAEAVLELFGGQAFLDIMRHPERVEAYWMDPGEAGGGLRTDVYREVAGPVVLSDEQAKSVIKILSAPESYLWTPGDRPCGVTAFGPKLSFVKGDKRVEAFVCFGCLHIAIVHGTSQRNLFFDPSEKFFLRLMTQLFPGKL